VASPRTTAGVEVRVDPDQFRQILVNLLANACDAAGPRGASPCRAARRRADVVFVVNDDGPGIAPACRHRLFEPLVSTKVRGIGLGLALCRRLAERNGGARHAHRGPSSRRRLRGARPRERGRPDERRRVLVVDDNLDLAREPRGDPLRRGLRRRLLRRPGRRPRRDDPPGATALALIDLRMPGMDGVELHRALKAVDPTLRALAMTAFARDDRVSCALADGVLGVLPKPMDAGALVQQVRRAVA
jgi:CheY-like chemotaxis protein